MLDNLLTYLTNFNGNEDEEDGRVSERFVLFLVFGYACELRQRCLNTHRRTRTARQLIRHQEKKKKKNIPSFF